MANFLKLAVREKKSRDLVCYLFYSVILKIACSVKSIHLKITGYPVTTKFDITMFVTLILRKQLT